MKIYTRTGDTGETSLIGGTRVSKADLRIDTYGTVDELNAHIGLLRDQEVNESRRNELKEIQDRLFTIGAELATEPEKKSRKPLPVILDSDVDVLEEAMDRMDADLPPLRNFVLPGGHQSVSFCHLARTVCRRAERLVAALSNADPVDPLIIKYLNRLSDYLFVLGRKMTQELGIEEVTWQARV
ncbi:cob(I)yrinic acid a,c-diamide adenosyltransferase [Tellurirhabdus bombi]|uniref:cob(I)yrinic acid a,c-diamide adenosyltransferase n=1 Tax=Tellurirhabdus bombi TaxID=2907205 RepID=UPI001F17BC39|nr:cob(I)yrinic acid a,c-diamide adenosyltransferase [Tellurirhabdus bombi]